MVAISKLIIKALKLQLKINGFLLVDNVLILYLQNVVAANHHDSNTF